MTPQQRAKAADLVVVPPNLPGTLCQNCQYFQGGNCINPKVKLPVQPHWCCIYWETPQTQRVWQMMGPPQIGVKKK